ncbi:hypothetical protein PMIN03_002461 [Paraphaeosphaeria minitans]
MKSARSMQVGASSRTSIPNQPLPSEAHHWPQPYTPFRSETDVPFPGHTASLIVSGDHHPLPGTRSFWATEYRYRRRPVLNAAAAPGAVDRQEAMPQIEFRAHPGADSSSFRNNTLVVDLSDDDATTEAESHPTQARSSKKQQDAVKSRETPLRRTKVNGQAVQEKDTEDDAGDEVEETTEDEDDSAPTEPLQPPRARRIINAAAAPESSDIAPSLIARPTWDMTPRRGTRRIINAASSLSRESSPDGPAPAVRKSLRR